MVVLVGISRPTEQDELDNMTKKKPGARRGRPPARGQGYEPHPTMQLGRVPPEERAVLNEATAKSGGTFIAWALPALLREARRIIRGKGT